MEIERARLIAGEIKYLLEPFCERIQIAGSIRRGSPNVKDIEIVAIPKPFETGLFENGLAAIVNKWPKEVGELPCKYTRRILPEGIKLDLFFATEKNWGYILLLRTGPQEFSKLFIGSLLPKFGFQGKDGNLLSDGRVMNCPDETYLFSLVGMKFIPASHRQNFNIFKLLRK